MFKYTCLNPISQVGLDIFDNNYKIIEDMDGADAALVRSAAMHDMELPESLKAIARAGAGVNNIPLDKCADKGIVVFNTPGANANGVKELVLCGMLLAARDVVGGIEWVKSEATDENIAKTTEKKKKAFAGTEIKGKKLGIIGLGAIGIRVANAALALGMEVYGYDPYLSLRAAWNLSRDCKHAADVNDIFKECDYITIHVPALDSTKGMISAEAVEMMKDTAVILNFARDVLVDEDAVVKALAEGKLGKYVVDFPTPKTAGKEGVIVIPHLGASTEESEDNCAVMAAEELREYLENGNIQNSVNFPNTDLGVCQTAGRIGILHKNVKGMIGKYSAILGDDDINIENMTNGSKGEYAYSLIDIDRQMTEKAVKEIEALDDVIRVVIVK
ncbi:MAG: 3-phosphoglycerate dehydrogenase [Eubacterium sp.]|nr:3-phosphoglycerate dehydrogenase [Eubacterium sp.]